MHRTISRAALWLASCAVGAALAQSAGVPDAMQLERRIASVETLIERSSGAKQIEASGVAAALAKREAARARHREAVAAYKSGDLARTAALLPEAASQMVEAVRLAAPEQVVGAKRRTDFDTRLESTRALLAAQKRIVAEKKAPDGAQTTRAIEGLIAQAEGEAAAGRLDAASGTIEQAYLVAKAAIGSLRGGDTLVRSLNFESPEEEYRYELDRNDTHHMLLKVLLDESKVAATVEPVAHAAQLRKQAEGAAGTRDFRGATHMLEESTRELVRAIRAAGIYIPG
ncbi:MAG TPA: hypothetical protein VFP44_03185 [Usitatibacter sp.]|nr:hypothetical protein [Usitatibacter sp.]